MRRGTKAKGGKRGGRSRSVGTKTKMPAARGDASAAVRARKRPEKTLELNEVLQPRASTTANLPTPDFTFDPDAPGACIAGVRPYRNGSYRLDAETASGKFIVHNYGHGGAGITLSWGCAAKVRDIVQQHLVTSRDTKAAVRTPA